MAPQMEHQPLNTDHQVSYSDVVLGEEKSLQKKAFSMKKRAALVCGALLIVGALTVAAIGSFGNVEQQETAEVEDVAAVGASYKPYRTTGSRSHMGECQGDCDRDNQCARGLMCGQRNGRTVIPGCSGGHNHWNWDYCYNPKREGKLLQPINAYNYRARQSAWAWRYTRRICRVHHTVQRRYHTICRNYRHWYWLRQYYRRCWWAWRWRCWWHHRRHCRRHSRGHYCRCWWRGWWWWRRRHCRCWHRGWYHRCWTRRYRHCGRQRYVACGWRHYHRRTWRWVRRCHRRHYWHWRRVVRCHWWRPNGGSSRNRLHECYEKCISNSDCKGRMYCARRHGWNRVPGCAGRGQYGYNYCTHHSHAWYQRNSAACRGRVGRCGHRYQRCRVGRPNRRTYYWMRGQNWWGYVNHGRGVQIRPRPGYYCSFQGAGHSMVAVSHVGATARSTCWSGSIGRTRCQATRVIRTWDARGWWAARRMCWRHGYSRACNHQEVEGLKLPYPVFYNNFGWTSARWLHGSYRRYSRWSSRGVVCCGRRGCTNRNACNFDPHADSNDGSCWYARPSNLYVCRHRGRWNRNKNNIRCKQDRNRNGVCDVFERRRLYRINRWVHSRHHANELCKHSGFHRLCTPGEMAGYRSTWAWTWRSGVAHHHRARVLWNNHRYRSGAGWSVQYHHGAMPHCCHEKRVGHLWRNPHGRRAGARCRGGWIRSRPRCKMYCARHWRLTGHAWVTVNRYHGRWNRQPTCKKVECPLRRNYRFHSRGVTRTFPKTNVGGRVHVRCQPGFRLVGAQPRCNYGGRWSRNPRCVATYCRKFHVGRQSMKSLKGDWLHRAGGVCAQVGAFASDAARTCKGKLNECNKGYELVASIHGAAVTTRRNTRSTSVVARGKGEVDLSCMAKARPGAGARYTRPKLFYMKWGGRHINYDRRAVADSHKRQGDIIRRYCAHCHPWYRNVYYKRMTPWGKIKPSQLFTDTWKVDVHEKRGRWGIRNANVPGNKMNKDFRLYSSIYDARANRNPWTYCNGNDPAIGFPRDCGRNRRMARGGQWNSRTRGGQRYVFFQVFRGQHAQFWQAKEKQICHWHYRAYGGKSLDQCKAMCKARANCRRFGFSYVWQWKQCRLPRYNHIPCRKGKYPYGAYYTLATEAKVDTGFMYYWHFIRKNRNVNKPKQHAGGFRYGCRDLRAGRARLTVGPTRTITTRGDALNGCRRNEALVGFKWFEKKYHYQCAEMMNNGRPVTARTSRIQHTRSSWIGCRANEVLYYYQPVRNGARFGCRTFKTTVRSANKKMGTMTSVRRWPIEVRRQRWPVHLRTLSAQREFVFSFDVYPRGVVNGWTNVIMSGAPPQRGSMRQMPSVFFFSRSTRLHVRLSRRHNWNDGCDPREQLPINRWSNVRIEVLGSTMRVLVNGMEKCRNNNYGGNQKLAGRVQFYTTYGSYRNRGSNVQLRNINYVGLNDRKPKCMRNARWNSKANTPVCLDIDECKNNPCKNGARCENKAGGYECHCEGPARNFHGPHCQDKHNDCPVWKNQYRCVNSRRGAHYLGKKDMTKAECQKACTGLLHWTAQDCCQYAGWTQGRHRCVAFKKSRKVYWRDRRKKKVFSYMENRRQCGLHGTCVDLHRKEKGVAHYRCDCNPGFTKYNVGKMTKVLGIRHRFRHVPGQYFNFNWGTLKQTLGNGIRTNRRYGATQCRGGRAIWHGTVVVWSSKNGGATGDAHGRRAHGARKGQWRAGDYVVRRGQSCDAGKRACDRMIQCHHYDKNARYAGYGKCKCKSGYEDNGANGSSKLTAIRKAPFYKGSCKPADCRVPSIRGVKTWITKKGAATCPRENGFCVKSNGGDQNSGVIKLDSIDGASSVARDRCLKKCQAHPHCRNGLGKPGCTGCEIIWSQGNRGCYLHTQGIARGNKVNRHNCWVFSKCSKAVVTKKGSFMCRSGGSVKFQTQCQIKPHAGFYCRAPGKCMPGRFQRLGWCRERFCPYYARGPWRHVAGAYCRRSPAGAISNTAYCNFRCQRGYDLVGPDNRRGATLMCGTSGRWGYEATRGKKARWGRAYYPKCRERRCPTLKQKAVRTSAGISCGARGAVTGKACKAVKCAHGFSLAKNGPKAMKCQLNGKWSRKPVCVLTRQCASIITDKNGMYANCRGGSPFGNGQKCTFACKPGYRMRGKPTIKCDVSTDGTWSANGASCVKIACPAIKTKAVNAQGAANCRTKFAIHKPRCTFKCAKHWRVIPAKDATISCDITGKWAETPKCVYTEPMNPAKKPLKWAGEYNLGFADKSGMVFKISPQGVVRIDFNGNTIQRQAKGSSDVTRCPGFPCGIVSGSDIVGIPDLFFAYVGQTKGKDHFATKWVPGTKGTLKVWQYRKGKLVQKGRTVPALSNKLQRRTQQIPISLPKDVPVTAAQIRSMLATAKDATGANGDKKTKALALTAVSSVVLTFPRGKSPALGIITAKAEESCALYTDEKACSKSVKVSTKQTPKEDIVTVTMGGVPSLQKVLGLPDLAKAFRAMTPAPSHATQTNKLLITTTTVTRPGQVLPEILPLAKINKRIVDAYEQQGGAKALKIKSEKAAVHDEQIPQRTQQAIVTLSKAPVTSRQLHTITAAVIRETGASWYVGKTVATDSTVSFDAKYRLSRKEKRRILAGARNQLCTAMVNKQACKKSVRVRVKMTNKRRQPGYRRTKLCGGATIKSYGTRKVSRSQCRKLCATIHQGHCCEFQAVPAKGGRVDRFGRRKLSGSGFCRVTLGRVATWGHMNNYKYFAYKLQKKDVVTVTTKGAKPYSWHEYVRVRVRMNKLAKKYHYYKGLVAFEKRALKQVKSVQGTKLAKMRIQTALKEQQLAYKRYFAFKRLFGRVNIARREGGRGWSAQLVKTLVPSKLLPKRRLLCRTARCVSHKTKIYVRTKAQARLPLRPNDKKVKAALKKLDKRITSVLKPIKTDYRGAVPRSSRVVMLTFPSTVSKATYGKAIEAVALKKASATVDDATVKVEFTSFLKKLGKGSDKKALKKEDKMDSKIAKAIAQALCKANFVNAKKCVSGATLEDLKETKTLKYSVVTLKGEMKDSGKKRLITAASLKAAKKALGALKLKLKSGPKVGTVVAEIDTKNRAQLPTERTAKQVAASVNARLARAGRGRMFRPRARVVGGKAVNTVKKVWLRTTEVPVALPYPLEEAPTRAQIRAMLATAKRMTHPKKQSMTAAITLKYTFGKKAPRNLKQQATQQARIICRSTAQPWYCVRSVSVKLDGAAVTVSMSAPINSRKTLKVIRGADFYGTKPVEGPTQRVVLTIVSVAESSTKFGKFGLPLGGASSVALGKKLAAAVLKAYKAKGGLTGGVKPAVRKPIVKKTPIHKGWSLSPVFKENGPSLQSSSKGKGKVISPAFLVEKNTMSFMVGFGSAQKKSKIEMYVNYMQPGQKLVHKHIPNGETRKYRVFWDVSGQLQEMVTVVITDGDARTGIFYGFPQQFNGQASCLPDVMRIKASACRSFKKKMCYKLMNKIYEPVRIPTAGTPEGLFCAAGPKALGKNDGGLIDFPAKMGVKEQNLDLANLPSCLFIEKLTKIPTEKKVGFAYSIRTTAHGKRFFFSAEHNHKKIVDKKQEVFSVYRTVTPRCTEVFGALRASDMRFKAHCEYQPAKPNCAHAVFETQCKGEKQYCGEGKIIQDVLACCDLNKNIAGSSCTGSRRRLGAAMRVAGGKRVNGDAAERCAEKCMQYTDGIPSAMGSCVAWRLEKNFRTGGFECMLATDCWSPKDAAKKDDPIPLKEWNGFYHKGVSSELYSGSVNPYRGRPTKKWVPMQ